MQKNDLLVCIREDEYCIEDLVFVEHPKVGEIVKVKDIVTDEDGVWLCLISYNSHIYDANCFKPISLKVINELINQKVEVV